jgi:hypothetical protein
MTGLNLQREQLERAEGRIIDINNNLEHAERHIRGIDSWYWPRFADVHLCKVQVHVLA